ncbi:MAG: extracellular solute-binding protein [Lachnospiraceae bacterium]|jgi:ABC-type glycerol-3-phosphate transport system substrate-binding protein|nr:extracellular solute-binding protein [Lachnospiraceae bacterium]
MKKKLFSVVSLVLIAVMLFAACNKPAQTTDEKAETTTEEPAAKKDIKFYGKIVEYSSGEATCLKLEELLADKYNIESLQVDWGNLEQVIRTGIGGGEPCDIYNYWPQYLSTFTDSGMALDLTPYMDADGGAWRDSFDANLLGLATYDGKIYGVPTTPNFSCLVANVDLFKEAGVDVPEGTYWSWDDFLAACEAFKAKDIFPWSNPSDNQKANWIFGNGIMGLAKDEGKVEAVANGEVPCTDPIFEKAFTLTKELYDKGYMYPGEGAVTLTTDESRAAFAQGKVALSSEVAAGIGAVIETLDFEAAIVPWPSMGKETTVTGGADGLFIPSNVKDPDAAVEVLKTYTSPEVQQINADYGFVVAVKGTTSDDPIVTKLSDFGFAVCAQEIASLDAVMTDYYRNQALSDLVLGDGVQATMDKMEEIRQQVTAE